ncbi:MAG: hypothetical protein M3Z02_09380, partial [Actinomycetota bacterium]|nr:hypothetical protein [Actinomycetota bacterium]
RVEAERVEAARVEAARVEAARVEAERLAAEDANAERVAVAAAEQYAAEEALRLTSEEHAAEQALKDHDFSAARADAASLLAEMSMASSAADVEPEPDARLQSNEDEPAFALTAPEPYVDRQTDTAALLRELSFLGLDDDAGAPGPTAPAPRAPSPRPSSGATSANNSKKRKGLFGR